MGAASTAESSKEFLESIKIFFKYQRITAFVTAKEEVAADWVEAREASLHALLRTSK